ncbi:MAG: type VII secretion protein EssC, partial [Bacilli bacterium]|nr:type VII secretion protein EssC [Bacilli bacterium]
PTVIMTFSSLLTTFFTFTRGSVDKETLITTFVMMGSMLFLSFVWPFIERFVEKIRFILREKARKKNYRKYLAYKREFLEKYRNEQKIVLLFNNLSIEECQNVIFNRTSNLFSLNVSQEQFLNVRIGVGKTLLNCNLIYDKEDYVKEVDPLKVKMEQLIEDYKYIDNSPITVSFKEPIAFINAEKNFDRLLDTLLIQLAAYHDYHILKLVILTNENTKLHYIRNLNHCWNEDRSIRYVATNLQEAEFISNELMKVFTQRISNHSANNSNLSPFYLILCDDINKYRNLKIIDSVVHQNEMVGFSFATFVSRLIDVPDGCSNFCEFSKDKATIFKSDMDMNEILSFTPEFYTNHIDFSRCLSELSNIPVKSNLDASIGKALPEKLGFLEMFNVGNVEQLNSLERWKNSQIVNTLATPIGVDTTGNILNLDLHEKKHGPHGLVAGMTGSGKSELIITYLLSLAVNYSPDEVQFVLIDYKGGGLAGAFENRKTGIKLPHLVGTITNLDTAEMNRTLVSIKSELQRRQRIFNKAKENLNTGTIDIYKYQGLVRDGQIKEPLSHLFIVCDEFAELKQQQPEFMDEIVSAARIGRSLGIHLILATQKPSGVVDDQVWSNSKFKICCKVQTAEDSTEMLRKPDAAFIKESGRFYLQIGYDEYYILAQSGYSGVEYVPTDRALSKLDNNISFINSLGEVYKNATVKKEIDVTTEDRPSYGEELINVVKYLIGVAKNGNYQYHQLWLDNIPEMLMYSDLISKYNPQHQLFDINPVIGEYDDPARQNQGIVTLPITFGGNTFIVGNSGSGKCSLLSSIIFSTIVTHSSNEVNIYILDMGAEKLKKFKNAPQVGDVLTISDKQELNFFTYMIQKELLNRQKYFSENGGDFLYCVKNKKCPFPNILVFIYDLDTLKESIEYFFEEKIVPLTRNCAKYGIYFIITSNTSNALGYSAEQNFSQKIMLNMVDTTEYNTFFTKPPIIKKNAGRGLISINEECFEFQVSMFASENNEVNLLKKVINQLNESIKVKAKPVSRIPNVVTYDLVKAYNKGLNSIPLGINTATAQVVTYNFDQLVSVMCSERIQPFNKIYKIFQKMIIEEKDTKLIILNGFSSLHLEPYNELVKMYETGFSKILTIIKNNIQKYIENPKNGKF